MGCFNNFDTKLSFVITFKIIYMFYYCVVYGMPVGTLIFIVFYNRYISISSALYPVIVILSFLIKKFLAYSINVLSCLHVKSSANREKLRNYLHFKIENNELISWHVGSNLVFMMNPKHPACACHTYHKCIRPF